MNKTVTLEDISNDTLYKDFSKLSSELLSAMFNIRTNSSRIDGMILKILLERKY